jgi:hypothetical protein
MPGLLHFDGEPHVCNATDGVDGLVTSGDTMGENGLVADGPQSILQRMYYVAQILYEAGWNSWSAARSSTIRISTVGRVANGAVSNAVIPRF